MEQTIKPFRISIEAALIFSIGVLDLVTTMAWIGNHGADEANPIFKRYLAFGPLWFAAAKMILLLAPIFILEWARRRRPRFAKWGARAALVGYVSLYVVGVIRLNPGLLDGHRNHHDGEIARMSVETPTQFNDHAEAVGTAAPPWMGFPPPHEE